MDNIYSKSIPYLKKYTFNDTNMFAECVTKKEVDYLIKLRINPYYGNSLFNMDFELSFYTIISTYNNIDKDNVKIMNIMYKFIDENKLSSEQEFIMFDELYKIHLPNMSEDEKNSLLHLIILKNKHNLTYIVEDIKFIKPEIILEASQYSLFDIIIEDAKRKYKDISVLFTSGFLETVYMNRNKDMLYSVLKKYPLYGNYQKFEKYLNSFEVDDYRYKKIFGLIVEGE